MTPSPSFPQFRKDPLLDRWVLIAPERAAKPTELDAPSHLAHHEVCPFCEGREHETPHESYALRSPGTVPDTPGWRVRVVPNRYPAARRDAALLAFTPSPLAGEGGGGGYEGPAPAGSYPPPRPSPARGEGEKAPADDPLWIAHPGRGVHEVVVECPHHEPSLAALSVENVRDLFGVYRDRLAALRREPGLVYAQVFKNHGAEAGASVEHAHSQILGLPRVPRDVRDELDAAAAYRGAHGRCAFCDLLARELASGERLVLAGEHCVAVTAFAGRFPYETWILPRRHASHYDRLTTAELDDLAAVMRSVLRRLGPVAYNFILHTGPLPEPELAHYHWHWEILPRLTGIAGYELATGYFINPLPPEEAARRMRAEEGSPRRHGGHGGKQKK